MAEITGKGKKCRICDDRLIYDIYKQERRGWVQNISFLLVCAVDQSKNKIKQTCLNRFLIIFGRVAANSWIFRPVW